MTWLAALALSGCTPDAPTGPVADGSAPAASQQAAEPARSRKRSAPAPLAAVTRAGIRYAELRAGRGRGLAQNGGYIVATDIASGTELWFVRIYAESGDANIEADKRDVYITRLALAVGGDSLLIENERSERYALSLKDRSVQRIAP